MKTLHNKIYIIGMYLFAGIVISNTSYGMNKNENEDAVVVYNKNNSHIVNEKTKIMEEDFTKNIEQLSDEDLEKDNGKISHSVINRWDKFWIDNLGRRTFLEAK